MAEPRRMLWGARFERPPHDELIGMTSSVQSDLRLLPYDAAATKAHARALQQAGLLGADAAREIEQVCDELASNGAPRPASDDEDVHSMVERILTEKLGDAGRRVHAGRSRNDLVAADLRLWSRDRATLLARLAADVASTMADLAEQHADSAMPGYTHLQRAQPVSLGFHLVAHALSLVRDGRRFIYARDAADESPLGAGALAGTTLVIDPQIAADELGFGRSFDNAMDVTSERDFACDLVYAAALCGVHLSRLAEEIVLWTSAEFGFAQLADEWSTGSSMMPQKRNADPAELVRGRAGRGIGDLVGLLTNLKGLPLAYNRDLQEGKELLFDSVDRIESSLRLTQHVLGAISFDVDRMESAARGGALWATDLAEELVARGVPFREAHAAVGSLVADLEANELSLRDASIDLLRAHHRAFVAEDTELADPARSLEARSHRGGTAPQEVRAQADRVRAVVKESLDRLT
jgi:argininosuccinate lyase